MLKSLEDLDYPKERIAIIFVDGRSTDGTYEVLAEWVQRKKHEYHSVVLLRVESNIPQARNICVRNMKGDYIFFWNADTIGPKNALKVALETLSQTGALAAICTSYLSWIQGA